MTLLMRTSSSQAEKEQKVFNRDVFDSCFSDAEYFRRSASKRYALTAVLQKNSMYEYLEQKLASDRYGWRREVNGTCPNCDDGSKTSNVHRNVYVWLCCFEGSMLCAYCAAVKRHPELAQLTRGQNEAYVDMLRKLLWVKQTRRTKSCGCLCIGS